MNIVSFVNDGYARKSDTMISLLVKVLFLVFTVTLAMILVYHGDKAIGVALYVTEGVEFVLFVIHLIVHGR